MLATRRLGPTTLLIAAAVASGCGAEDEETPSACLDGAEPFRTALATAPGEVALEDGTPISECLVPEQDGGELAQVGEAMIAVATDLNGRAQDDPTGEAAIRLGYLVGAVERGSEGIHADLMRRLSAAARFSPEGAGLLPPEFERTFGRGYAAGLDSG